MLRTLLSRYLPLVLIPLGIGIQGCSSARMSDSETDSLFRSGQYDAAAERLKAGWEKEGVEGRDSLLYLLDYALALHSAGRLEESTRMFLKAADLAEIKDYSNLATDAATLAVSDNIKQYKAEDFENVLINVYLALNYALMGKDEDALVEARRVNQKLYKMKFEGKRDYKQDALARYLSAVLYEKSRDWNDSYIDYKNAHAINPALEGLGQDLWRLAMKVGITDEARRWEEEYKLTPAQKDEARRMTSAQRPCEIVVIYQNGISPVKRPHPNFASVPKFYPRNNPVSQAEITVTGVGAKTSIEQKKSTFVVDNIEATAIETLDQKWSGIVAKKIAGVVVKEGVGYAVAKATDSPLLGALTRLALYASDEADIRSWNLLPKDIQVARFSVPPGTYTVKAQTLGAPADLPTKTVQVRGGGKIFVNFRYMP